MREESGEFHWEVMKHRPRPIRWMDENLKFDRFWGLKDLRVVR